MYGPFALAHVCLVLPFLHVNVITNVMKRNWLTARGKPAPPSLRPAATATTPSLLRSAVSGGDGVIKRAFFSS